jgi:hypothetical protein
MNNMFNMGVARRFQWIVQELNLNSKNFKICVSRFLLFTHFANKWLKCMWHISAHFRDLTSSTTIPMDQFKLSKLPKRQQYLICVHHREKLTLLGVAIIATKWSPLDTVQIKNLDQVNIWRGFWGYTSLTTEICSKTNVNESSHAKNVWDRTWTTSPLRPYYSSSRNVNAHLCSTSHFELSPIEPPKGTHSRETSAAADILVPGLLSEPALYVKTTQASALRVIS